MIAEALAAAASGSELAGALARLGGPLGDDVRAQVATLAALSPAARKAQRATWAAAARAPTPPGARGVHPSWIEAALRELPKRARADLAAGGGNRVAVWLVRTACAALPALPPVRLVERVERLDDVLALPSAALSSWLENVGAEQFAVLAIASKSVELVQRRPGDVGARLRAAVARVWPFFRKDLLGYPLSEVAKRCSGTPLEDLGLARIGARTIAPYVAARFQAAEQLAYRLPQPMGVAVLAELRAFAGSAVERVPSWRVLSHVSVVPS